jgi:putative integral membrane protein (TIGR02587 family)
MPETRFFKGLGRAAAGALIFMLPMLMTMEMWDLAAYMSRTRLAILIVALAPLLVALSHVSGFEDTFDWKQDVVDAFVACAVAAGTSATVLLLFDVVGPETPIREWAGNIALQLVPGSIGALLAHGQFGGEREKEEERSRTSSYGGELLVVLVGALFLSLNIAPTEEIIAIAYSIGAVHSLALVAASLLVMHVFLYSVEFHGAPEVPADASRWRLLAFYTLPGYAVVLLVSAFVLWTFGRFDGAGIAAIVRPAVILAFPAAIGGAAARLLI